jgi:hypothetical protein
MIIIVLIIVFGGFYFFQQQGKISTKFNKYLYDYRLIRFLLIIWIVIGFFKNWDYSDQWGCFVHHEPVFRELNIILSGISLVFIVATLLFRNKKVKVFLHVTETIYWIGKLIVFKGGYATGIAGAPDDMIVLYDFIAILLRGLVLRNLVISIRTILITLFAFILMIIKIFFFPTQITLKWEYEKGIEASKQTLIKMQGCWKGHKISTSLMNDTIYPKAIDSSITSPLVDVLNSRDTLIKKKWINSDDSVFVKIDSNIIEIRTAKNSNTYFIDFDGQFSANLFIVSSKSNDYNSGFMKQLRTSYKLNPNWSGNSSISVIKIRKDSLIFSEGMISNEYKLKKTTPANTHGCCTTKRSKIFDNKSDLLKIKSQ